MNDKSKFKDVISKHYTIKSRNRFTSNEAFFKDTWLKSHHKTGAFPTPELSWQYIYVGFPEPQSTCTSEIKIGQNSLKTEEDRNEEKHNEYNEEKDDAREDCRLLGCHEACKVNMHLNRKKNYQKSPKIAKLVESFSRNGKIDGREDEAMQLHLVLNVIESTKVHAIDYRFSLKGDMVWYIRKFCFLCEIKKHEVQVYVIIRCTTLRISTSLK